MRPIVSILIFLKLFSCHAKAQTSHFQHESNVFLSIGKMDMGGMASLGYNYYFQNKLAVTGSVNYAQAKPFQSKYSWLALTGGASYSALSMGEMLYVNTTAEAVLGYEFLDAGPIKKGLFNPGVRVGGELEYAVSEAMSIALFARQYFYMKNTLGNKRYDFGITIKVNIL